MYFRNIYLHIPFCKKKCKFCDFFSTPVSSLESKNRYTDAILQEVNLYKNSLKDNTLDTVYFGGGTPVELGIKNLRKIIGELKRFLRTDTELTIELNPENLELIEDIISLGFNRISVGIQSFNTNSLKNIERLFNTELVFKKLEYILNNNLTLSLDFMFGLPGESIMDIKYNLEMISKFKPQHVSYYMFTTHKNYKYLERPVPEDELISFMYMIKHSLAEHGYKHYEISNYAIEGKESRHNLNYWKYGTYLGLGAGAHSFDSKYRWWNTRNFSKYFAGNFIEGKELLTLYQHNIEQIMLGLRMLDIGVNAKYIDKKRNKEIEKMLISYINNEGEEFYKLNPSYIHLLDKIEEELV